MSTEITQPAPSPGSQRWRTALRGIVSELGSVRASLVQALRNDGIRRLGLTWMLGIAADGALVVVTLVTVYNHGGIIAAGLLGAFRMVPAVASGMLAGTLLQRFRGDRLLIALGLIRAAAAGLTAFTIATAGHSVDDEQATMVSLFVLAAVSAAASAPIRPTQVTLMPAIARNPEELVAANTVWSTGEGIGAFAGPLIASILMAAGVYAWVAGAAAIAFVATALICAGLRFEQSADASGGGTESGSRFRLADGLRAVRAKPVLSWTILGTYSQVLTRGLLNALVVVAAIDLLGMGQSGAGQLSAAFGLGGLLGAISAMVSRRSDRLVRTEIVGLAFWGLPLSIIGVVPDPQVALFAMIVIGVANATYAVALFTILQRASANDERAPVLSVLEGGIGLGAVTGSLLAPVLVLALGSRGGLIVAGAIAPIVALAMFLRIGRLEHITVVDEAIVALLRRVPSFAQLPMTAVERLAGGLEPFSAAAGTALMTQGEPGDRFLIVATGDIDVFVDGELVHRLGPGAGVGEIALLRRSPRTATVIATTDVTGYSVDSSTFLAAVAGPAAMAMAERMAQANLERRVAEVPRTVDVGA